MIYVAALLLIALAWWAVGRFVLAGEDLGRYDAPAAPPVNDAPSAANGQVLERVRQLAAEAARHHGRARLRYLRRAMDSLGENADLAGVTITPVTAAGRPAEWLTPEDRAPRGRLLYLHGGAFTMGSPLSHRSITAELARRTGLAVLSLDYRLMPEHRRLDANDDSHDAYRWMLEHGPDGDGPPDSVFVAGDSAGGTLTLELIAWARDQPGLRQPDGAMALSPLTDATLSSPSLGRNANSDPLLGPMARMIRRVPRSLMLWSAWLQNRLPPADPRVSPARGALAGLPPVLVQASEAEILIDDARRYVNKARAAGSPAELETWRGMVHVWPAFGRELPEAEQAFERMSAFVERVLERRGRADAA